jgi:hypothetical protein
MCLDDFEGWSATLEAARAAGVTVPKPPSDWQRQLDQNRAERAQEHQTDL